MVNAEYKQFSRFCLVGVVNTAVNYVSYIVLLSFLSHYYLFAGAIGFLLGAVCGFFLNRHWTFGHLEFVSTAKLGGYLLVGVVSLLINVLVLYIGVVFIGIPKAYAQLCGIAVTTLTNYLGVRCFVFTPRPAAPRFLSER